MHQLDTPGNPSKRRSKDFRVVLIYKTQARSISSPRSLVSWGSWWGFPPTKKATKTECCRNRRGLETEIWTHSCCKNPPPWWFAFGCLGCGYMEWDTWANYKKAMSWCWVDCGVFPIVGHTLWIVKGVWRYQGSQGFIRPWKCCGWDVGKICMGQNVSRVG